MNDGGPAFPFADERVRVINEGMSLRDYFAAAALTGFFANSSTWMPGKVPDDPQSVADASAMFAYMTADAMLAARQKGQTT